MTSVLDPFRMGTPGRGGDTREDEWRLLDPLHGDSMLELGNKRNGDAIYKAYFESLGYRHVSVDWNGRDGALKRDLRLPLWDELGQFDMLTNIGTTEHVSDQRGVWENIHHLVKPGGLYCGLTPYPDGRNWWWHGDWYPTEDFFRAFADLNGWQIDPYMARSEFYMGYADYDVNITVPQGWLIGGTGELTNADRANQLMIGC